MAITAGKVKELREKTGLPMMECKKALEEAGGDDEKAMEILRQKGSAQISKRAGRETGEGRVVIYNSAEHGRTAIIEALCETAPVADNDHFVKFVQAAAQAAAAMAEPTPEAVLEQPMPGEEGRSIGDFHQDMVNRIRENIKLGRIESIEGNVGTYVHHDGKTGVVVQFNKECPPQLAAGVCMHVAAMRPMCTRREEVDPALVEAERKVAREQVQGKPENIIDKIVDGKINKWYSEIVLLEQPFVIDDKKSVGEALQEADKDLTVTKTVRIVIGGA